VYSVGTADDGKRRCRLVFVVCYLHAAWVHIVQKPVEKYIAIKMPRGISAKGGKSSFTPLFAIAAGAVIRRGHEWCLPLRSFSHDMLVFVFGGTAVRHPPSQRMLQAVCAALCSLVQAFEVPQRV